MHALTVHPGITPGDRLAATIVFAVLTHLIVILGVTFVHENRPESRVTTLDVVLVPRNSDTLPDQADFLAQANQDGGGNDDVRVRPETPPPPPAAGALATTVANASAQEQPAGSSRAPLDARRASASLAAGVADSVAAAAPAPGADTAPRESRRLEMAALSAEIERKLRTWAERPRRKWISARTREDRFAAYMVEWRRKVERVGNLNYPDQAARLGLSGNLLLEVALNPDGTVADIALRRSSGEPILDDAAVRIVKLAAPFAPFPPGIAEDVDILHIERTWFFHSDRGLTSP